MNCAAQAVKDMRASRDDWEQLHANALARAEHVVDMLAEGVDWQTRPPAAAPSMVCSVYD